MEFALTSALREQADRARKFAQTHAAAHGASGGFNRAAWDEASAFGIYKTALPASWGGRAEGAVAAFAIFEALGRGGMDRSLLFAMGAHLFGCALPVAAHATPDQNAKWGAGLCDGSIIGALAVTEPAGGSSFDLIATQASEALNGYILTGEKTLVCNAPDAGLLLVLARQFKDRGPLGLTAFLVPRDAPGLSITRIPSLGLSGAPMGKVVLAQCQVPASAVLGRPGAGLRIFATAMQWERTCLLAGFLGAAERDLAVCVDAFRTRRDSGGALFRHQAISHRLARLKLKLDSARLVGLASASAIDRHRDDGMAAAMAKLAISEAVEETAEQLLKLMAGSAWQGQPLDFGKALDDTFGGLFASGTSEIQLDIIARALASEPRAP
jgi:alkylation response protein AidB-like acyl-CoA dehydrogenase